MGLDNYKWILFTQPDFLVSLKNTAYYTLAVVVLLISLALIFAVWMQKDRRINRIAQSVFFTPHLVATLSCAFIWQWLYNSESYGLLNSVLDIFGLGPVRFLDSSATAMNCVVAMNCLEGHWLLCTDYPVRAEIHSQRDLRGRPVGQFLHPQDLFPHYLAHAVAPAVLPADYHHHRLL